MDIHDTRGDKRVPVQVPVVCTINDSIAETLPLSDRKLKCHLFDVSVLGCAFLSKVFFPKNVMLHLEIEGKVFYRQAEGKNIQVTGKIVNCRNASKETYRIGVVFVNISQEDQAAIQNFVREHS